MVALQKRYSRSQNRGLNGLGRCSLIKYQLAKTKRLLHPQIIGTLFPRMSLTIEKATEQIAHAEDFLALFDQKIN